MNAVTKPRIAPQAEQWLVFDSYAFGRDLEIDLRVHYVLDSERYARVTKIEVDNSRSNRPLLERIQLPYLVILELEREVNKELRLINSVRDDE